MYDRKRGASVKTHALLNRICQKDQSELGRRLEQYEASWPIYTPTVEVTSKNDQGGVRAISPAQDIVQRVSIKSWWVIITGEEKSLGFCEFYRDSYDFTIVHIEADLFGSDDVITNANKNSTTVQGSVLPKYIVRTWKYRVSGYCGIQFRFAPQDDVRLVQIDECLEFSFFSWALHAITIQWNDLQLPPLLFGRTSNRAGAVQQWSHGRGETLVRRWSRCRVVKFKALVAVITRKAVQIVEKKSCGKVFFRPQGGRCTEVQLHTFRWRNNVVKEKLKPRLWKSQFHSQSMVTKNTKDKTRGKKKQESVI